MTKPQYMSSDNLRRKTENPSPEVKWSEPGIWCPSAIVGLRMLSPYTMLLDSRARREPWDKVNQEDSPTAWYSLRTMTEAVKNNRNH